MKNNIKNTSKKLLCFVSVLCFLCSCKSNKIDKTETDAEDLVTLQKLFEQTDYYIEIDVAYPFNTAATQRVSNVLFRNCPALSVSALSCAETVLIKQIIIVHDTKKITMAQSIRFFIASSPCIYKKVRFLIKPFKLRDMFKKLSCPSPPSSYTLPIC
jgi:hypothetical protein